MSQTEKHLIRFQQIASIGSFLEIVVALSIPQKYPFTYISTFARIIFLMIQVRPIRRTWVRFMQVMLDSASMILFIISYVMFFAFLGYRIFRGSVEGVQYFSDYIDSCFNMLVLLTTANSPDIMLPAYEYSRPFAIFFVLYLLFGVFLILHLLMAQFYSNYKVRLTR